jgi:hypothetical protein
LLKGAEVQEGFVEVVKGYPYLFANIMSLAVCLIASRMTPQGNMIIVSGLLSTPCFFLLAVPPWNEYWNPVRVGGWVLGVEDVLCSFDVGALAWLAAGAPFGLATSSRICHGGFFKRYAVLGSLTAGLFTLLWLVGLEAMTSLIATCFVVGAFLFALRRDLRFLALSGLIGFPILYSLIVSFYFRIWPDFAFQWKTHNFWGRAILGLPAGEVAWAVVFGFFWPLFVGHVCNVRLTGRLHLFGFVRQK